MTNAEMATELRGRAAHLYQRARFYRDRRGDLVMAQALRQCALHCTQDAIKLDAPERRHEDYELREDGTL